MNTKNNRLVIILLLILIALVAYVAFGPKKDANAPVMPVVQTTPELANPNLITKTSWGISFIKPSNWNITSDTGSKITLTENVEGGDRMTVTYISGSPVTDTDS